LIRTGHSNRKCQHIAIVRVTFPVYKGAEGELSEGVED